MIFKHSFTGLEGSFDYHGKNWSLRLQHLLRSLVFICTDFQVNIFRTLYFLVELSFFFPLSGTFFCIQWVKVVFCTHFFLAVTETVASKIVNTMLVHFPYKVKPRLTAHSLSRYVQTTNTLNGNVDLFSIAYDSSSSKTKNNNLEQTFHRQIYN